MSRVNVRVRPATEDDVAALVALVQSIDTATGPFSGKPLQDSSDEHLACRFREIIEQCDRTLLIAAEKDDITPIEAERHLATLFPDAALVEIPDVGHLIHYETPEAAASAIREFLDAG